MADEFLTITQLAGRLEVRERALMRYVKAGTIPYYRIGKALRFRWSQIERWLTTVAGRESRQKVPAIPPDTFGATEGIHLVPEGTTPTAETFTRGRRRHVSMPSVVENHK